MQKVEQLYCLNLFIMELRSDAMLCVLTPIKCSHDPQVPLLVYSLFVFILWTLQPHFT